MTLVPASSHGQTPLGAAGGDLAGTYPSPLVANLHLSGDTAIGHKLTSVTDPTAAQDAATKNYVDTAGMVRLATVTLAVDTASIDIPNIAQTYRALRILIRSRKTQTATTLLVNVNGDGTAAHYTQIRHFGGTSAGGDISAGSNEIFFTADSAGDANAFGTAEVLIDNYASTSMLKTLLSKFGYCNKQSATPIGWVGEFAVEWNSTAAITSVTFFPSAGSLAAGSTATLYGLSA